MKIAYLGIKRFPSRGGTERVVEAIATRMPSLGIDPTVYCDRGYSPSEISIQGVKLVRLPAIPGKHLQATTLDLLAALHAVFLGEYDLIHLHNAEASFVLPLLRLKYDVVATSHGAAYWRAKWGPLAKRLIRMMELPFMKLSTVVTSVSAKEAEELGSRFGRPVLHIPNGVGMEYAPDFEQAKILLDSHGLVAGEYFIFVAGRIEPTKGAHLAIDAVNRLGGHVPLLVVGDTMQVPAYGRLLRQIAGPNMRFQPLVEDPGTLFGLIARALCLIFPSLVEAMSMVLLEAACIGTPVVCSNIVENRQVLRDDAVYFESGNVESLAEQLEWVLNHRADISLLSRHARERIQREYSWDTIAAQYAQLYQEVRQHQG